MIVKNEEDVLERCLKSTGSFFDEIIITDTGSTDKTKEVAKKFTDKIYDFEWVNDFSKARNFSFSKATGDYIMWLDADDVIEEYELKKLIELKSTLNGLVDCYMLKYVLQTNERGQSMFEYYRERIIKNDKSFFWQDPIHEVITPHGKIEYLDISIHHKKLKATPTDRNLIIYESMLDAGLQFTPRQQFYYSRELFYNKKYEQAIESFEKYLKDNLGWIENKIEACITLSKCYLNIGNSTSAKEALFKSFNYDQPRAEVLCELGSLFIHDKQYKEAVYWLKLAKKIKINTQSGAFVIPQCYNEIPNLLLCVCYYNLGNIPLSIKHNNLVLKQNPQNPSALINKNLFEHFKKEKMAKKKQKN